MAHHEREVQSLRKALSVVDVDIDEYRYNTHIRIKIRHRHTKKVGNITLSVSPSDFNVMRQRERQIRKELKVVGVTNPDAFNWRKI